jgi:glycosyltransferase involved in cell wall biosynthesis
MSRICIITPGHLSTNPRLVKEADALAEAGHMVSVIAANFAPWARQADAEFVGRRWKVAETLQFGPTAPLHRRALQALRQRAGRIAAGAGIWSPAIALAAWHPISFDLVVAARRVPAELYIAHYPAALAAAALAAQRYGGRYAFDAEDFHPGDLPDGHEFAFERRLLETIERRYLPGCAYVTAASPGIAAAYVERYGIRRPTVVLNVFPRAHGPSHSTPAGTVQPGPSVYWFSQTIGPDRGLECAVRAIGRARARPHLYLRGNPAPGFTERLITLAKEVGAGDRLHVLAPGQPADMERLAAAYDVGFVGETGHTLNRRVALCNKLFSYMLAGLPTVMSDIPAHADIVEQLGAAARLYRTDDAESLAAAFDDLFINPPQLANARAAAFELAHRRYNWDVERNHFVACVAKSIPGTEDALPQAKYGDEPAV